MVKIKKSIPIIFEDDYYIVFDKPANLLVIPTPKEKDNTLTNIVNYQYAKDASFSLHPCHRLDRETSGAIVFAKGKKNQQAMMELFKKGEVQKRYLAFAHGRVKNAKGEVRSHIKGFDRERHQRGAQSKYAITSYKVLEYHKHFSMIEVLPQTGRTNQIRIHLADLGYPLVGESKYAFRKDFPLKFRRTALHASKLNWKHPVEGKNINVTSELPDDMVKFLKENG